MSALGLHGQPPPRVTGPARLNGRCNTPHSALRRPIGWCHGVSQDAGGLGGASEGRPAALKMASGAGCDGLLIWIRDVKSRDGGCGLKFISTWRY